MARLAVLLVIVASCSRVPEEPSPIVKPTADKAQTTTATPTPTPKAPEGKACPADPEPAANDKLYDKGTAAFVTNDGVTHTFKVEIARTADAQERGLMYRTSLAEDAGMVFDFAEVHHATFWMHNTCIPLDMIFVNADKRVLGVVTAPPLNDEPRSVPGLSKYVVELAAGVAHKRGITAGARFVFPAGS